MLSAVEFAVETMIEAVVIAVESSLLFPLQKAIVAIARGFQILIPGHFDANQIMKSCCLR